MITYIEKLPVFLGVFSGFYKVSHAIVCGVTDMKSCTISAIVDTLLKLKENYQTKDNCETGEVKGPNIGTQIINV